MKILEYKMYYEPEVAASMFLDVNTVKDFVKYGFDVELYTPQPTRGIDKATRKATPKRELLYDGKLLIHRYAMYREGKNTILRAVRYSLCCLVQLWKGICAKDIDVMFAGSTPPMQGAVLAILKKIKKVPFVYNLQDIFPDSMVDAGLTQEGSLAWKIGRKIENFTYKNADAIIVISEDFKNNLIKKGVPKEKIKIICNWVNENEIVPVSRGNNTLLKELKIDANKFLVVYAGNLGKAQDIDVLIRAAYRLKKNKNIEFVVFGSGVAEDEYKRSVKQLKLENFRFFPLQPYERVSEVYSMGDACVVSCMEGCGRSAMPSKTWSIMSCERAVLASFDKGSSLQHIVESNEVGLFSKSGDDETLSENILKLFNDRNLCEMLGKNGRKFVLDNLTRNSCTTKICKLVEQTAIDFKEQK